MNPIRSTPFFPMATLAFSFISWLLLSNASAQGNDCEERLQIMETDLTTSNNIPDLVPQAYLETFYQECILSGGLVQKEDQIRGLKVYIVYRLLDGDQDTAAFRRLLEEVPGYELDPESWEYKYAVFRKMYKRFYHKPNIIYQGAISLGWTRPVILQDYSLGQAGGKSEQLFTPSFQLRAGLAMPISLSKTSQNVSNTSLFELFGEAGYGWITHRYQQGLPTSTISPFNVNTLSFREDQHWGDVYLGLTWNAVSDRKLSSTYPFVSVRWGGHLAIGNRLANIERLNEVSSSVVPTDVRIKDQRKNVATSIGLSAGILQRSSPTFRIGVQLGWQLFLTNLAEPENRYYDLQESPTSNDFNTGQSEGQKLLYQYGYVSPDFVQHQFSISMVVKMNRYRPQLLTEKFAKKLNR